MIGAARELAFSETSVDTRALVTSGAMQRVGILLGIPETAPGHRCAARETRTKLIRSGRQVEVDAFGVICAAPASFATVR